MILMLFQAFSYFSSPQALALLIVAEAFKGQQITFVNVKMLKANKSKKTREGINTCRYLENNSLVGYLGYKLLR